MRDVLRPCLSALIYLHAKVAMLPCSLPDCLSARCEQVYGFPDQLFAMQGIIHRDVKVHI